MDKKIKHEQIKTLIRTVLGSLLAKEYYSMLVNYVNQQEKLEKETNEKIKTVIDNHDEIYELKEKLEKELKLYKELSEMVTILSPERLKRYSEIMDELRELKS